MFLILKTWFCLCRHSVTLLLSWRFVWSGLWNRVNDLGLPTDVCWSVTHGCWCTTTNSDSVCACVFVADRLNGTADSGDTLNAFFLLSSAGYIPWIISFQKLSDKWQILGTGHNSLNGRNCKQGLYRLKLKWPNHRHTAWRLIALR